MLFALPIVTLVIYLFYTWFAIRDRYLIFLYFHDMGSGFDTSPFGWVTVSRYWMAGLVAGGAVMVLHITLNILLGRLVKGFRAPDWRRLWLLCAIPLLVIIPAIVMTVNEPVLPLINAAQVTAAALIGLALAVMLGQMAAKRPLGYVVLMGDGIALTPLLLSLVSFEDYPRWLARGSAVFIYLHLAIIGVGIGLPIITTGFYYWRRRAEIPDPVSWFAAGLMIAYLVLPLGHHLFWCKDGGSWTDPDYFAYISDADNYFARNILLQLGTWLLVALLAWGFTRLRRRLVER